MKAGDALRVEAGWVSFGTGLLLRAELIQSVSVEPASAVNVDPRKLEEVPAGVHSLAGAVVVGWAQLEVKYAPRSAPYVVFVGTDRECRCKAAKLARELRGLSL